MIYNTQRKKLPMPEYGRGIQEMVDYALTLENREERQRCARTIVSIMGNMFPHLRDVPDFKHKLWDHLAIMSDFKLDIDYPYEVIKKENLNDKPDCVPYTNSSMHYRHYGKLLEKMLQKWQEMPEGEEKDRLIVYLANHMKKALTAWNKEAVDDEKILKDIMEYTHHEVPLTLDQLHLKDVPRENVQRKNKNNGRKAGR